LRATAVAAIQATPVPGDVAGNAGRGERLVREAAARGAHLAVLPELFLSAYHPPTLAAGDPGTTHVAAGEDRRVTDPRLDPLARAAIDSGVVVVCGAAVIHPDGRRTCSSLVIDAGGTVTAAYDKQNLWGPDERALFTTGDRGATLEVHGWRFGLGVCYDGCFPEHGRAAADDGAHAYLCPSGYLAGSEHRRDVYYAARALDNTMYVVFANSVGPAGALTFNGGAAVYDPEGRALVRAPDAGEAVVVATLDPEELARVRSAHTMLLDRAVGPDKKRRLVKPLAAPAETGQAGRVV
jgi:predicted amidohydrolase